MSFENQEWEGIIEQFADDADLSYQLRADAPPSGTWTYHSDEEYTFMDAIDLINQGLRLQDEPYTLIRYKNMLILVQAKNEDDFPRDLIERVTVDQLEQRGKYERLTCVFDLSGMRDRSIVDEIQSLFDRRDVQYFEVSEQLVVTGLGERLRTAKALIDRTKMIQASGGRVFKQYVMQSVPTEELLVVARPFLEIPPNEYKTGDGSLTIVPQPLGDKVYLMGTQEKIDAFLQIASEVDIEEATTDVEPAERPFLKIYPVTKDPALTIQVLQTVMQGRDIRLDQGAETGSVYAWARDEDHATIKAVIDEVEGAVSGLRMFSINYRSVTDAIESLQTIYQQSDDDTGTHKGPVFYADDDMGRLVVKGTPQELAFVEHFLSEWDQPASYGATGLRSNTRIIPADDYEVQQIMRNFDDYWPSTNRKNPLNLILPEDRGSLRGSRMMYQDPASDAWRELMGTEPPKAEEQTEEQQNPPQIRDGDQSSLFIPSLYHLVAFIGVPYQEEVGKSSQEQDEENDDEKSSNYKPADERPSVPGAPLTIKRTELGLVVTSDDLDALDDAVDLINQLLELRSTGELPAVFYLKHAWPDQAKEMLDQFLGISSGSGGGGGGLGGMMGNMMSNALGGGAGDMLGGLLGGGGSDSGSAADWLEGDVTTVFDMSKNSLIVMGATTNDLEMISYFIDYIDQPEAPHRPDLVGPTRTIPVFYRKADELVPMIEAHLETLLTKTESGGGGDPQAAAQAAVMRQIQQAMQGNNGGGSKKDPSETKPFAKVTADPDRGVLVVTGPAYVYDAVVGIVDQLDTPNQQPGAIQDLYYGKGPYSVSQLADLLKSQLGDEITVVDMSAAGNGISSSGSNSSSTNNGTPGSSTPSAVPFNPATLFQGLNQGGGRGGNRGGTRGGGGNRGGARGGGGFGGRGG
ncbi:MAG: secretin N-terminal domain-containing protein [Pirellulaceae bacterium]